MSNRQEPLRWAMAVGGGAPQDTERPLETAMPHETTNGEAGLLAPTSNGHTPAVRTTTVVVADDRPMMRAGVLAAIALDGGLEVAADCPVRLAVEACEMHQPDVMVVVLRDGDPEPFRAMAA